jgi:hypothetical protein
MLMLINDASDHTSFVIGDIYKLYVVENVDRYSLLDFTTHKIEVKPTLIPDVDTSYYLVIDFDTSHEAFAHWVYESAIYLPIFGRLKEIEKYKNIRILLNGRKRFKTLFLNFFNIPESDVCYSIDPDSNNTCIFPSPISALNDNSLFSDRYMQIVDRFIGIFHDYVTAPIIEPQYEYTVLPRQVLENYICNNRTYNLDFIYDFLRKESKSYCILNTDGITDLADQILSVRSSPNVVVTDGSPFLVNNMFCLNQNIYVVDTMTVGQSALYVKLKYIRDRVSAINNNNIQYIQIR